jgi:hypothetical protein
MDYLCFIKEISSTLHATETFPYEEKFVDRLRKLTMVVSADSSPFKVGEFILDTETRDFWGFHFGDTQFSTTWPQFARALVSHNSIRRIIGEQEAEAEAFLKDLYLRLDHYNTGHIVCHRLGEFVGMDSLSVALRKYKGQATQQISNGASSAVNNPLLLWIDDFPDNNEHMAAFAREIGIHVIQHSSTAAAKAWLLKNASVLEVADTRLVRIITDNVRTGANTVLDLNAGEDIIRFVRGRRSHVPILVYCGDLNYTRYVTKYSKCIASIQASACQEFIEAMASALI